MKYGTRKQHEDNVFIRARTWDGCQYKNFTRVAGGANPLMLRKQRLRNRYIKKFDFFSVNLGMYACTGCGRCIENCIAKIDLREIFRTLAKR
jgi:sulfhydrogenase subunit beta (sulfur reductase)